MKKILLLNLLFVGILYSQDSELENVEEVVVVGTKASLISAIDKQRASGQIISVVDSDALGEFPDTKEAIFLKNGRYGTYLQTGDKMKSLPPQVKAEELTLDAAIKILSAFIPDNIYLNPLPSSPTRLSSGIFKLSKNTSVVA